MPKDIDEYVHRIGKLFDVFYLFLYLLLILKHLSFLGRTGRVGNRGKATSFYDPESDSGLNGDLVRILQQAEQPVPAFLGDSASSFGGGDQFGGVDVRKPVSVGTPQQDEDGW